MRFRRPPVARPDRGGGRRINGRVFRSAFRRPTGLTAPALSGKADARFGSAPVPRPHSEWRETPRGSRSKAGRPSGSVCLRDCCGTPPFAAAGAFAAARLPPYLLVKCPCGTNKTNRREHNSSLRRSIVCSFVYFTPVSDSKGQNNQLIVFDHTDKPVIAYFVSPVPFPISDQRLALCFGIAAPLQVFPHPSHDHLLGVFVQLFTYALYASFATAISYSSSIFSNKAHLKDSLSVCECSLA